MNVLAATDVVPAPGTLTVETPDSDETLTTYAGTRPLPPLTPGTQHRALLYTKPGSLASDIAVTLKLGGQQTIDNKKTYDALNLGDVLYLTAGSQLPVLRQTSGTGPSKTTTTPRWGAPGRLRGRRGHATRSLVRLRRRGCAAFARRQPRLPTDLARRQDAKEAGPGGMGTPWRAVDRVRGPPSGCDGQVARRPLPRSGAAGPPDQGFLAGRAAARPGGAGSPSSRSRS